MRKLVAYTLLSLDGVADAPDTFVDVWDEAMDANLGRVIGSQDTVLLGRRSHDEWAEFWPGSVIEPFASFINGVRKHVVTSRPMTHDWANTTVVEGDVVAFVNDLKAQAGGDIGIHASLSLVQSLLSAGVVDELSLVIAPVIANSGRKLLDGVTGTKLELISSVTSPTGHLLVDYRVLS